MSGSDDNWIEMPKEESSPQKAPESTLDIRRDTHFAATPNARPGMVRGGGASRVIDQMELRTER